MKAKARILSALLSICMLISMLTCFVVPASATASKIDALLDLKHTLRFDEDGNFKVLTLSDIHGKGGYDSITDQSKANIKTLIDRENPDLVILNGDTVQMSENEEEFRKILDSIVGYIEEQKIPWAHVFGNHDDELYSDMVTNVTKEQQQAIYESYEYCVSKDVDGLYGVGNYVLPVLGSDNNIAFNVWCLDSNTYLSEAEMEEYGATYICDFIRQDQIDWYTETSSMIEEYYGKKIYGAMNFHIPLQEYNDAWADRANYNYTGLKLEKTTASDVNSGLFEAVKNQGDVKAIISGHDHTNDFMVDYEGVKLCYAGTPSTNGYYQEDRLGARVYTVKESDPSVVDTYMSYIGTPKVIEPFDTLESGIYQDFNGANTNVRISNRNDNTADAQNVGQITGELVSNRGYEGSAAYSFTRNSTPGEPGSKSRDIELEIDFTSYGKLGNNKYLRVWFDWTGNDGQTPVVPISASAGLISSYNYSKEFNTDHGPGKTEFYYLPEGGTEWKSYTMNTDGCYGRVMGHEELRGAKGWFAFPVSDMYQEGTKEHLSSEEIITGAYIYYSLCYDEPETYGQYVYIDEVALVKDYRVFGDEIPEEDPEEDEVGIDSLLNLKHKLRFNENGDFKILYLSDLHGQGTKGVFSEQTKENIKTLVEREDPDLVLLLGDNQQRCTTIEEFKTLMDSALKYLDEQKIPWAHVFGNHDEQNYFGTVPSNSEQQAVFEEYEYCISKDVASLDGVGNYLLPILSSKDESVAFNLWCMDYDITQKNIDWYIKTSNLLQSEYNKKIYGIFNSHIPLPEFETAWSERGTDYTGIQNEAVLHNGYNKGVFDQFLAQGDLTAIVAGHDHTNDYALDYKGIKLCYAGTASVDGYSLPGREGARVITLNESDLSEVNTYMSYIKTPVIKDGPVDPLSSGIHQDFSDPDTHYLISSFQNRNEALEQLDSKIFSDRGYNGSAALGFTRKLTEAGATNSTRNIELEIDLDQYGTVGDNAYLRVWMDFTGNNGDKALLPLTATAGLITNYDYDPAKDYCTDNNDGKKDLEFYYLPEGSSTWQTYNFTTDGCYGMVGSKQNLGHEGLRGAKGWFAFPIKDMRSSQLKRAPAADDIVTGAYIYYALDYSAQNDIDWVTGNDKITAEDDNYGEYIFIDDIALVKNYKLFGEESTKEYTGEVVSATGLVNTKGMPDIREGLADSSIRNYKITDRAGMVKLAELVLGGNGFLDKTNPYTFYLANDIDMEWKNFTGIGDKTNTFYANFEGNGFVIENLLMINPYTGTALFPEYSWGTIKNLGIASGFVMGGDLSGSNGREMSGRSLATPLLPLLCITAGLPLPFGANVIPVALLATQGKN